ncbi:hypothetical protein SM19410_02315 [Xanthomonas hortorum pv. gardneri]|nr:hypothetical protein SM17710_11835 [Xanthomonas hortorum pv. gardneri]KLB01704.1 hypothetical protein SM19410_02315 [Xanthomonas hortorum pv. gardneri]KLB05209.1 hypothetical protein SM18210_04415 [Xanthomonas hortorum pv. gardneri]KLB09117.1 hypothetical protein SM22010_14415 [Xanthomonas hortorum pv. gardneri]KLB09800.1 hypothetical protein SM23410_10860 [Xanthomonas hortorum pv. gardneri]
MMKNPASAGFFFFCRAHAAAAYSALSERSIVIRHRQGQRRGNNAVRSFHAWPWHPLILLINETRKASELLPTIASNRSS